MIKDIIKGMVIGVANIIPGVSGGTMAVSMGIYDKMISAITNLGKDFKSSAKFLAPILIGAVLSIATLSFVITYMFENIPMQTNLLFIGLIVGGLPAILKKVKGAKISVGKVIAFLIFFGIVLGFALVGEQSGAAAADVTFSFVNMFKLFGVGVIAAATMVIPGVSGSMMLMLMGYYEPIIASIKEFIEAVLSFDMDAIIAGVGTLAPFGIGCIVGIFAIAKIIEIIFAKCPMLAYFAIIGLIVASPFAIVIMNSASLLGAMGIINVITSVLTFAIGSVIAFKLSE